MSSCSASCFYLVNGLLPLLIRENSEEEACAICLEDWLSEGEMAAEMPCKHKFHYDCVKKWLASRSTCPLCRFEMPIEKFKWAGVVLVSAHEAQDGGESIDYYQYYNYADDEDEDEDDVDDIMDDDN